MEWQFEKAIVSSVNEILMTFYKETMSPIGGLLSTDYLKSKSISSRFICQQKLGNAVMRNKIKRRIRHILIECQHQLVADDFVIIARKGVEELSYQEMKQNLIHVLKLAKLYQEGVVIEKKVKWAGLLVASLIVLTACGTGPVTSQSTDAWDRLIYWFASIIQFLSINGQIGIGIILLPF